MLEPDENGIYEIDALPMAYMEIAEDGAKGADGEDPPTVRLVFKTMMLAGPDLEELWVSWEALTHVLRIALIQAAGDRYSKIIWWRLRPRAEFDEEHKEWYVRARLATTPPLPRSFWEDI